MSTLAQLLGNVQALFLVHHSHLETRFFVSQKYLMGIFCIKHGGVKKKSGWVSIMFFFFYQNDKVMFVQTMQPLYYPQNLYPPSYIEGVRWIYQMSSIFLGDQLKTFSQFTFAWTNSITFFLDPLTFSKTCISIFLPILSTHWLEYHRADTGYKKKINTTKV